MSYRAFIVGPHADRVLLMAPKGPNGGSPALPVVRFDQPVDIASVDLIDGHLLLTTAYPLETQDLGPVDDLYGVRVI